MPSPQRNRQLTIKESGALAETFVSDPRYREALNAPYADAENSTIDSDELHAHQDAADTVLVETIKDIGIHAKPEVQRWEAGRHAVMALLSRKALGSFENYFLGVDSIPAIAEAQQEELPDGEREAVATNASIVRLSNLTDDPIEFINTSLGMIDRQKKFSYRNIGPENYATTLKLFSDKYSLIKRDDEHPDIDSLALPHIEDVKDLTNETLRGFFDVAKRDEPNYLEMTNIYSSIRALPRGVVDPKLTHDILLYTTKNIDQLDYQAARSLLGAIAKIDTSKYPLEASAIVNMVLKQGAEFETTRDLRTTLRAIDSLTKNPQTDAALQSFFDLAEGLQAPLELDGVDEVIDRLSHIMDDLTDDKALSVRAKNFASNCMERANWITRQIIARGTLTQAQGVQLRATYERIKANYLSL